MNRTHALRTICLGGLVVGVLDRTAAVTNAALHGVTPTRVFQFVASGLLGPASFQGGHRTALFGVLFHLFIALSATAAYYGASRRFPVLIRHAVSCGILYGISVFFFMNNLVVPLSLVPTRPFSLSRLMTGIVIHMFFVGLPAALVTKASLRRASDADAQA